MDQPIRVFVLNIFSTSTSPSNIFSTSTRNKLHAQTPRRFNFSYFAKVKVNISLLNDNDLPLPSLIPVLLQLLDLLFPGILLDFLLSIFPDDL